MNSHFSGLQNRQKISESKKVLRRQSLVAKKNILIEYGSPFYEGEKNLPNLSDSELKKIKIEIIERIKKSNRRKNLLYGTLLLIIIAILIFFSKKYNVF